MPLAVFVLGLTIFSLGTTEFMIAGLLPELAGAFGVPLPAAGGLISLFALGVTVGAPVLALLSSRLPKKATLVALLAVFVAGEVLAASAGSFGVLMAARVVTALAHGAFFGIGAVVAAGLVPPGKKGRALSVMFGGLTIATLAGAPLGAFLGQHLGWRAPFWAVAVFGALGLLGVVFLVPRQEREEAAGVRRELAAFRRPALWWALATTALSQAGLYAVYTYLAPLLTHATGFAASAVPPLLALFGAGTVLGSVLGGRLADRSLSRTLCWGTVLLGGVLALVSAVAHSKPLMTGTLLAFGIAAFLINPALQARVLNEAEAAPTLASAANISAFNIGNAAGPWAAGLALDAGHSHLAPSWVGALCAAAALGTALLGGVAAGGVARGAGVRAGGGLEEGRTERVVAGR
ncbi:Cmx/CmrA family chloramphenicol efflux MFS transporter [Streptomyces sp. ODS28]|uniref:Cmx/CmrA family chloramphenicol efflux MFS transporter n=1 Tax=Streptomyces sp. ODS28 TaxID=3136688 RepID=UPI0031E64766